MPIDPVLIPALERELAHAKQVKPGGQLPRKDRIAAIEEQLARYRQAVEVPETAAPAKDDESNAPTDYESHDAKEPVVKRGRPKKSADGDELETADATEEADETA